MADIKKFNSIAGFSVGETNVIIDVVDNNANITANRLTVDTSANLGNVGNVTITGGSSGYVLSTDGSGTLAWTNPSTFSVSAAGSNTQIQFNNNSSFGASSAFTFDTSGNILTLTGNITTNNANLGNLVVANFFSGDGGYLSNINASNVGTVANANYAAYTGDVINATQSNITSLGTLANLSVTGNITAGDANLGNLVTANFFSGSGNLLSNIQAGNITGAIANANYAAYAGNVVEPSQSNITSVGTLNALTVSGLITATTTGIQVSNIEDATGTTTLQIGYGPSPGTLGVHANLFVGTGGSGNITASNGNLGNLVTANFFSGSGNLLSNIQAANINGTIPNANYAAFANIVVHGAQSNITSLGTLVSLVVTGNVTSGNAELGNLATANFFSGSGNLLSNIQAGNVSGTVSNATTAGTVIANAQPNITSLGTLNSVTATGIVNFTGASNVSLGPIANVKITGGNNGDIIKTDGSGNLSFLAAGTVGVSGSNTQVQYNNAGSFGASANFTFNSTSNTLTVDKIVANGAQLTDLNGSNVTGTVSNATTAGTVIANAQPNITSVGTLSSLTITGNVTAGNANLGNLVTANFFSGSGNLLSNIQAANVSGTVSNATTAGTVIANAQPNITSVGTLSSLTITGNVTSGNASLGNLVTANYFSGSGNLLSNIQAANVSGTVSNATTAGTVIANAQPNITSVGTLSSLTITGNVTSGNASLGNAVTANYFIGNFYGTANSATTAGTVTTNAQPNITSVGTLSGLNVTGDTVLTGNLTLNGPTANLSVTTLTVQDPTIDLSAETVGTPSNNAGIRVIRGDDPTVTLRWNETSDVWQYSGSDGVTFYNIVGTTSAGNTDLGNIAIANYFKGDGSLLTNINGSNINTVANANYAAYAGNIINATQSNITSLGTLVNLTVTGNVTSGNASLGNLVTANFFSGSGNLLSNIQAGNITGTVSNATTAGTVIANAQPNITSVGTLSSVSVTGNVSAGNANLGNLVTANFFSGSGNLLSNIQAANISGTVSNATTAGTVIANAQPNITSVGTLSSLTITGNVTSGNAELGNLVTANFFSGSGNLLSNIQAANVSGTVSNATTAGTVIANAQPNITSTGTLNGLTATGTVNFTSSSNVSLGPVGNVKITGGNNGDILKTDGIGNLSFVSAGTVGLAGVNTQVQYNNAGNFGASANFTFNNSSNTLTVDKIIANGSQLTDLNGSNVTGTVANATTAGTVIANAQPNITSVGTLANLSITGNVTAGNASLGNLVTANYVTGTLTTAAQPNITSVGTLSSLVVTANANVGNLNVTSDALINGNLTVMGNTTYINIDTYIVQDPVIEMGGSANGGGATSNDGKDRGMLLHYYTAGPVDAFVGWDASNSEFALGSNVVMTNDVVTTWNSYGNLRAGYYFGNASQLTGTIANANYAAYAGTVVNAAQPNITSLGTLSGLTVTGLLTATANGVKTSNIIDSAGTNTISVSSSTVGIIGNLQVGTGGSGNITASNGTLGNLVTANFFSGSGNLLSNIQAANITGTVSNATTAGTVTTAAQPNITSTGTLVSLNVTGNITSGGNVIVTANVSSGNANLGNLVTANFFSGSGNLLSNIQASNITGTIANANYAAYAGNVINASQSNITTVGTLANLSITGNLTTGVGTGGSITGANLVSANYFTGTLTTAAQPNITSVGTLSSLTVTGNITGGNANLGNLVTANFFSGDGGYLSNINASNVGTVANSNYAAYAGNVINATQSNITSVGTLANLTVTANITGGNANLGNLVTANFFSGSGNLLSNIQAANVSGTVSNATTAGTVITAAQPNITSTGTLISLNVTGNITSGGNVIVTANISSGNANLGNLARANFFSGSGNLLSNLQAGNITGTIANANYALYSGTVLTNAQPNITSVGTLANLTVTANITGGNANLGNLVTANYFTGTLTTAAQPNITSTGTLNGVTATGTINFTGASNVSLGAVGIVKITGGTSGQYLQTNGSGTLSWSTVSNIANGTSSVSIPASGGNVNTSVGGNANILVVTSTGANVNGYLTVSGNLSTGGNITAGSGGGGNITGANGISSNYFTALNAVDFTAAGNVAIGDVSSFHILGGTNGYVLQTDGLGTLSWVAQSGGGGGSVAGSNTQVQYNDAGNFGASSAFTFNSSTNTLSATNIAGTLTTAAQPNITSLGTLTSISVTSNVSAGNVLTDNLLYANGVAWSFTNYSNTNVAAYLPTYTGNLTAGNISGANLISGNYFTGTLTTGAQPNITSLGTLASLTITSNVTAGNANLGNLVTANFFIGSGNLLSNIQGANVTGTVSNATTAGTVVAAAQPNITSVGTLTSLTITGNVTAGNALLGNLVTANFFSGSGNLLSNIQAGNITGAIANANYAAYTGIVVTAAQPNITSLGTLANLAVTGNLSAGNIDNANSITSNYFFGTLGTASQPNITSLGTLNGITSNGVVNFTNSSNVTLGSISNLHISGGTSGYVLSTDGAGSLNWVAQSGGGGSGGTGLPVGVVQQFTADGVGNTYSLSTTPANEDQITVNIDGVLQLHSAYSLSSNTLTVDGIPESGAKIEVTVLSSGGAAGSNTQVQFNDAGNIAGNAGLTFDKSTTTLTANNFVATTTANLGNVGNVTITGGSSGQYLQTNGSGGLSWATVSASGSSISNGTSNVNAGVLNGNITIGVAGTSNTVVFTSTGVNVAGYVNATGNITAGNASLGNLVTANFFSGSGNLLSNIQGGNVSGTVSNATTAGTVIANAQPNITSVGTLASLTVTGNLTTGNLVTGGSAGNISGANYISANYFTGTLTTAAQPNITSVGTLTSLTITGNVSAGNANLGNLATANFFSGSGNLLSNIQAANITGTVSNATTAGTVIANAQPNITSVGTLSSLAVTANANVGNINATNAVLSGNATITGNLTVSGTTTYVNVDSFVIEDPIIEMGGGANGAPLTTNDGKDRGSLLHYYTTTTVDAFMGWDNSNAEFAFGSNVSVSSEVVTFNTFGNLRAGYFLGNGSQLTGTIANANYAAYAGNVINAAQSNITSLGTLTSLSITGNVTAGNALLGNLVTANFFSGSGNLLSNIQAANISGTVSNATTAGTVIANAQPNITSVGTLASLTVTGNITSGNATLGNAVTANYFVGNFYGTANSATTAGTVTTNAQPNITSTGTLNGLTATGTVDFTGSSNVSLGPIANVHISGGTSGYVLQTDGSGTLSWVAQSGGGGTPGGSNTYVQFNDGSTFGGNAGLVFDKTTTTLTANNFIATTSANLGNVGNVTITGGSADYVLTTDGAGNLTWAAQTGGSTSTTITVDNFTGNGVADTFTLSVTPTSVNSVFVNYNGAFVSRGSYSLVGANLTFGSIPANGSEIEVTTVQGLTIGSGAFTTRTDTGDNSTVNYTVTNGATVSSVLVTLDGVLQTPTTDYTISGATLTFTTAPATGVAIQIRELSVASSSGGGASNTSIRAQAMTMGIIFGG